MSRRAHLVIALLLSLATSCATSSDETWQQSAAVSNWPRPGRVESVREVIQRREGNPAGGALAGALIGGFLFGGRGPGALFGAASGAAVGAAASQSSETHAFQVLVHFDDGAYGMFVYAAPPPFQAGQPVFLTQQGLVPAQM
jgi:outer membrane lipoprotein SlyB